MKKMAMIIVVLFLALLYPYAAAAAEHLAVKKPLQFKTIAIDPGHGGYDPGAIWGDIYEKDINLMISKRLIKRLEAQGAKTILTRNGDYNHAIAGLHGRNAKRYDLNQRIKLIESNKADTVITIHVNSVRKKSYEGAEAFYHPKSQAGERLALAIQEELKTIPGMKKRIAKISNCYMLCNTKAPAVLVEVGYLSNPRERERLQDPRYLDTLAQKITDGIVNYYIAPDDGLNQGFLHDTASSISFLVKVLGHTFYTDENFETRCNCIMD